MKCGNFNFLLYAGIFLFAGTLSIIRIEPIEAIISFAFSGLFFLLRILLKEKNQNLLEENLII